MVDAYTSRLTDATIVEIPQLAGLRPSFLALHIVGGLVGLPVLTITLVFSKKVPRQPALINFCISWVVNSVSYTLLGFSGNPSHPPFLLCSAQAAMVFGAPPMSAIATFLVVFKIWQTFRNPHSEGQRRSESRSCSAISLTLPYITFVFFFVISVVIQSRRPWTLKWENGLYCTLYGVTLRRWGVPTFSMVILLLVLGFEASIAYRYFRSRKRIAESFPLAQTSTSLGLVVRITLFNVCAVVTLCASIFFITGDQKYIWPYMIQATLPLVAFLLFATQKHVILTWCFWTNNDKQNGCDSNDSTGSTRRIGPDTNLVLTPVILRNGHEQTSV